MKITHVLMETAHGPLNYADMASGGRGVTGSEQAMLYLAKAQAEQGNKVVCYLPTEAPGFQNGVEMLDVRTAWPRLRRADSADVVISWLTADPLRHLGPKPLKIHSLQINDWMLCGYGYEKHVDVFVACSNAHKGWLMNELGNPGPSAVWEIIPNGTDCSRFMGSPKRIKRSCVYFSSPDRGLHWALAMWPEIRFAFPDAELHVYYEVQKWIDNAMLLNSEVGNRAKYVVAKSTPLAKHGVTFHGALPITQLAQELLVADVMIYPCDTIRATEGFGVAILDACAAGVVPVITDADALGEIYNESGAIVVPLGDHRRWVDAYLEQVLQLLGNQEEIETRRAKVQEFAKQYDWKNVAGMWQSMIERKLEKKRRG
ncbi:MAG: glycosyltransferase family 4 protein [Pseudomonadota bacterium]|nr:glycosyltransferase family 4 protein [Pseudomonadota bacterium]